MARKYERSSGRVDDWEDSREHQKERVDTLRQLHVCSTIVIICGEVPEG
jgi:hypothetical protein